MKFLCLKHIQKVLLIIYKFNIFCVPADGLFDSDGVVGVSGVSSEESEGVESAGALAGVAAEAAGPLAAAFAISIFKFDSHL